MSTLEVQGWLVGARFALAGCWMAEAEGQLSAAVLMHAEPAIWRWCWLAHGSDRAVRAYDVLSVTIVCTCSGHGNTRRAAGLMHRLLLGSGCSLARSQRAPPPFLPSLSSARREV